MYTLMNARFSFGSGCEVSQNQMYMVDGDVCDHHHSGLNDNGHGNNTTIRSDHRADADQITILLGGIEK